MLTSTLLLSLLGTPLQAPGPAAPAGQPSGRRYATEQIVDVAVEVPTNVGLVKGTIPLLRMETRGIDGWGRFELRGALDPSAFSTGDAVLDAHVRRSVLLADEGPLVFGSTQRLAPKARPDAGGPPEDALFGAGVFLDGRRQSRYVEVRYAFLPLEAGGRVKATLVAPLADLGLRQPKHPFVEVTGPVKLTFDVPLVRR